MSASPRMNAVRSVSAIGAGVLLASTPHCGGKSVEEQHDSNEGGTSQVRGGASGSAGTDAGYGGFIGTGGSGGTGAGAYGGYGGAVGLGGSGPGTGGSGGTGVPGVPYCQTVGRCWTPTELRGCWPDAGVAVDAGPGTGIGGEGGAAADADEPPMRIGAPPPNIDAGTDSGNGAAPEPPIYECPVFPPFPYCVMAPPETSVPLYTSFYLVSFTGTQCCYNFEYCE